MAIRFYENTPEQKPAEQEFLRGILEQHFKLGLVVEGYSYYIDEEESDENANTILYRPDGSLASDNYFATSDIIQTLEEIFAGHVQPEFMADSVKENMKLMAEAGMFEE